MVGFEISFKWRGITHKLTYNDLSASCAFCGVKPALYAMFVEYRYNWVRKLPEITEDILLVCPSCSGVNEISSSKCKERLNVCVNWRGFGYDYG